MVTVMPVSSTSSSSAGLTPKDLDGKASPPQSTGDRVNATKAPATSLLSSVVYDFGCVYFLGAVLALVAATYGGLLFLDNETALVSDDL
jgi:hypothetical protein